MYGRVGLSQKKPERLTQNWCFGFPMLLWKVVGDWKLIGLLIFDFWSHSPLVFTQEAQTAYHVFEMCALQITVRKFSNSVNNCKYLSPNILVSVRWNNILSSSSKPLKTKKNLKENNRVNRLHICQNYKNNYKKSRILTGWGLCSLRAPNTHVNINENFTNLTSTVNPIQIGCSYCTILHQICQFVFLSKK